MFEVLRFNPFICEAFYADEIILVEGPTEEIIVRAFLQESDCVRNYFIMNCGSITNMPFYQKVFSKFHIKYNLIFDTDGQKVVRLDDRGNPVFSGEIQGTISEQFQLDAKLTHGNTGILRIHDPTFEPAHMVDSIPSELQFHEFTKLGKPYNANEYWKRILKSNLEHPKIEAVPIIHYMREIVAGSKY